MGHYTATIRLERDAIEAAKAEVAAAPANRYMPLRLEDVLLRYAVHKWQDEDAERWASENAGTPQLTEAMPMALVDHYLGGEADGVGSHRSLVIPIVDDVVTKTVKAKVAVTAEQLASIRACVAAGTGATHLIRDEIRTALGAVVNPQITKLPAARKPVATATEGAARTRYQVIATGAGFRANGVIATCDTQAQARAAGIAAMEADERIVKVDVKAVIVRDSADGVLVTITRPASDAATVEVTAESVTVKPGAQPSAYVVAFDYHL